MKPKEAIAVLRAAFPGKDLEPVALRLYEVATKDIQPQLLEATVRRIIQHSRFFPSIAEIRQTAAQLAGVLPATAEEAAAIVRRADVEEPICTRDGEYRYAERYWRWPEDISPQTMTVIEEALAKVGDPVNVRDGQRVFAWETDFKRMYETKVETIRQKALGDLSQAMLPEPRKELTP